MSTLDVECYCSRAGPRFGPSADHPSQIVSAHCVCVSGRWVATTSHGDQATLPHNNHPFNPSHESDKRSRRVREDALTPFFGHRDCATIFPVAIMRHMAHDASQSSWTNDLFIEINAITGSKKHSEHRERGQIERVSFLICPYRRSRKPSEIDYF